jgi:phosphoglycerate dehydrogenase-like enzyme
MMWQYRNPYRRKEKVMTTNPSFFRIGFSADFLDDQGKLVFPDIGLAMLDASPDVSYEFLREFRRTFTPDQLDSYDVVVSLGPGVTAESIIGVERLCAIGRCGVGCDSVDLAACTQADIVVYNTPQAVIRPMAESVVLLVLALSHNLVWKDQLVRRGRWEDSRKVLGRGPRDCVVGTIGLGGIASEAIRLLRPFAPARLLAFDPYINPPRATELGVEMVSLQELLRLSDYVLVNCPLTPETRGLIGDGELRMMKAGAVLINTARGPIVNEAALIRALEDGAIRAAALDVFEKEPLSPDSPLLRLENVVLTSHSVGWTEELFREMGRADCEGALAIARGELPACVVNRDVLERAGFRRKLKRYGEAARKSRSGSLLERS